MKLKKRIAAMSAAVVMMVSMSAIGAVLTILQTAIISFTMLGMKRLPITMLPIAREQIVPAVVNSTL